MAPQPNIQGDPPRYPNPPKRPENNENVDSVDDLDPAELARLYEEVDRFERLTTRHNSDRSIEDLNYGIGSFDMSAVYGIILVVIVAMTIYGFTHLLTATFKGFRFQ